MRDFRDVEGEFSYGLEVCGTSGAPSPTDLWFVWFFGASGVLSPRDLGCGVLQGVEGAVPYAVEVCGVCGVWGFYYYYYFKFFYRLM